MQYYELTSDSRFSPVQDLLRSVDRPGDYCTHGRLLTPMPRLEVDPAGAISFPIPETQIRTLVAGAERAPYGKGPETLVDTAVRDAWQIAPERVRLGGRAWDAAFRRILDAATEGLGCPEKSLAADLYKLLVYEPGGRFAPHRDTEKAPGMVATLVVALPTAGAGGTLVVRHKDRETVIDMQTDEPSELTYAAFYADCVHEIRPVAEGHRICLVYNLMLHGEDAGRTASPAPDYGGQVEALSSLLADWDVADAAVPDKIVWLLEHDYSQAGLSFAALKHVDAAVGRTLREAAERSGCLVHAAVVHVEEQGTALYDGFGRDEWDDADLEMDEHLDTHCWLDSWIAPDGARPDYGNLPLGAGELMPAGGMDEMDPDEKRIHEATGNGGATVEHVYRSAALVAWPRAATFRVLARGGIDAVLAFAEAEHARYEGRTDAQDRLRALADQLVNVWAAAPPQENDEASTRQRRRGLALLGACGHRPATMRFLHEILLPRYRGGENDALLVLMGRTGPEGMRDFLSDLIRTGYGRRPGRCLDLVARLDETVSAGSDAGWRDVLRETARTACAALPMVLADAPADRPPPRRRDRETSLDAEAVRDLFRLAWRFDLEDALDEAAAFVAGHPALADPARALPLALEQLRALDSRRAGGSSAFAAIWHHAAGHLLARSETPPETPRTWVLPVRIDCNCEHCAELQAFCDDPIATERVFAVREDLRDHLRSTVRRHRMDVRCEERKGRRPYRLVCTKTRASHERRLAEYAKDVEAMRRLIATTPAVPDAAATTARLRAAAARSGER